MGQNTSRARPSNRPSESAVSEVAAGSSRNGAAIEPSRPARMPSRRQSVRRSIMNLVSLRKSTSIHDQPLPSPSRRPSRRNWRMSRRLSEAPAGANSVISEDQPSVISSSMSPHPHPPPAPAPAPAPAPRPPPASPLAPEEPSPHILDGKGKAKETNLPPQEERPPASNSSSSTAFTDGSSSLGILQGASHQESTNSVIGGEELEEEVVISPTEEPDDVETTQTIPPSFDPTQLTATPSRPFPPPGTLVVVQGVVHTTDVSRQPPAPTPSPAPSSRNRLSAFIPRPSSMLGTRPASYAGESSSATPHSSTNLEIPSADSETTSATPTTNESETIPSADTTAPSDAPAPGNELGPAGISPSSIDVLGTLLSVAAAATAASLLTGSSDPIFSSGLAPRTGTAATAAANDVQPPSLPSPTSPQSLFSGLSIDPQTQAQTRHGGRERMRHTWGALRERLGLRNPGASSSIPGSGTAANTAAGGARQMDARDVMLAEMARAFNVGLGMNTDGEEPSSRSDGEGEGRGERQMPPENSFERFLLDLQADLRAALSAPEAGTDNEDDVTAPSAELGARDSASPATAQDPLGPILVPSAAGLTDSAAVTPPQFADVAVDASRESADEETMEAPSRENVDFDEMPVLEDISDDEDDGLDMDDSDDGSLSDRDLHRPDSSTIPPTPVNITPGSASRTERRPGGGINWWRLYRFPPISTPQAQGLSASLNGNGFATSSASAAAPQAASFTSAAGNTHASSDTASTSTATPPSNPSTSSLMPGSPAMASSTAETTPNIVVPVIVVGLQSVNLAGRHPRQPPQGAPDPNHLATPNVESDEGADEDFDSNPPPPEPVTGNGEPGRGRRWQSRAANAFRNLRPGRRGNESIQTGDGIGSRTFLIYVIGGYYPPDHQIVTSGNALDSFEALWELAELLGQVKPPTVTREDIANSGLEVIKPALLEQYEKEGKVSSNCVDKCLICLDDYDAEDDLRLLNCRHAFHRACVDKWLETGRNNCPACRSTGVPTDTAPSAPLAPIPAQRSTHAS